MAGRRCWWRRWLRWVKWRWCFVVIIIFVVIIFVVIIVLVDVTTERCSCMVTAWTVSFRSSVKLNLNRSHSRRRSRRHNLSLRLTAAVTAQLPDALCHFVLGVRQAAQNQTNRVRRCAMGSDNLFRLPHLRQVHKAHSRHDAVIAVCRIWWWCVRVRRWLES